MVRLMLVLAPIMCIFGGIAISGILSNYIRNIDLLENKIDNKSNNITNSTKNTKKQKDDNYPYKNHVNFINFLKILFC